MRRTALIVCLVAVGIALGADVAGAQAVQPRLVMFEGFYRPT